MVQITGRRLAQTLVLTISHSFAAWEIGVSSSLLIKASTAFCHLAKQQFVNALAFIPTLTWVRVERGASRRLANSKFLIDAGFWDASGV
ncbi:hypothetical protein ACKFKG_17675 [Phormidesmis sp. 146-35]